MWVRVTVSVVTKACAPCLPVLACCANTVPEGTTSKSVSAPLDRLLAQIEILPCPLVLSATVPNPLDVTGVCACAACPIAATPHRVPSATAHVPKTVCLTIPCSCILNKRIPEHACAYGVAGASCFNPAGIVKTVSGWVARLTLRARTVICWPCATCNSKPSGV